MKKLSCFTFLMRIGSGSALREFLDQDQHSTEMLDQDLQKLNADPQHVLHENAPAIGRVSFNICQPLAEVSDLNAFDPDPYLLFAEFKPK